MLIVNPLLTPAYIIHTRLYRNTSLIVECFTAEFGVFSAVAKGARRTRSAWRGLLMPGQPLLISAVGKQELLTLTQAEMNGTPLFLQGTALFSLFYLNELISYLLQRFDPHPHLYHYYANTLARCCESTQLEPALRLFEWRLLQELGYGLNIETDANSYRAIRAEASYKIEPNRGVIETTTPIPGITVRGQTLIALAQENVSADANILAETKQLMRQLLQPLLGQREIRSRALFIPTPPQNANF